ncbi:MAG: hypothetical protein ABIO91_08220 [Pyrinomonadaceae bacterium]
MFAFIMFEFIRKFELDMFEFRMFEFIVLTVGIDVAIGVGLDIMLKFRLLLLTVLFAPVSPHPAPIAPIANTGVSAIVFIIRKSPVFFKVNKLFRLPIATEALCSRFGTSAAANIRSL